MASKQYMAGWLSGFFDGEGSAFFKTECGGKRHTTYCLSVGNTDLSLMHTAAEYLDRLGIGHTRFEHRVKPGRKPFYVLHISKAIDILAFYRLVGFRAAEKQAKLEIIVAWVTRSRAYYRSGELIALRKEGLSFREIAKRMRLRPGAHHRLAQQYKKQEGEWLM